MATTTIPWGDGSGDNIYLTYPSASGDQTVSVSSDANTGAARSKVVSFTSGVGSIVRTLTVEQEAGATPSVYSVNPYTYDPDHQYYSLSTVDRAYRPETASNACAIGCTRGSVGAVTYIYFKFNTSALPQNITIKSIEVRAKATTTTNSNNYLRVRQMQVFSGTTAKGTPVTLATNTGITKFTFGADDWTRTELNDVRIRLYAERGTTNLNNAYSFAFTGATLEITYYE